MGNLGRQTRTLLKKNVRVILLRHPVSTIFRATFLPIFFIGFISYAKNLFVPPAIYGIGTPAHVKDLQRELLAHSDKKLAFVHNNLGSEVRDLIDGIANPLIAAGGKVVILEKKEELQIECKQTLRGSSPCFSAAVFNDSPTRSGNGVWNYTLRGDSSLGGGKVNVENHDNDVQTFLMPLQFAIDKAIANRASKGSGDVVVDEYMFTSLSQEEREDRIRRSYITGVTEYIGIAVFLGHVGIIYHQTGFQASERERGISTLLESMGVAKSARILAYFLSFSWVYFAGWVVMGLTMARRVFATTNTGLVLIWFILTGFSCASFSIFASSFFKKAQLSGISTTLVSIAIGIIAQVYHGSSSGAIVILSLLCPSSNFVLMAVILGRFEKKGQAASLIKTPPDQASTIPAIVLFIFLIVQIIAFAIGAAFVEKWLYGTESAGHRSSNPALIAPENAVELRGFTKRYKPSILGNLLAGGKKETVTAVNKLDLDIRQGQVLVLLGANGSGKTTTLEAIAGLAAVDEGEIRINTGKPGGVGVCPQKNVFWDELTVEEHVRIWNKLKCEGDSKETLHQLLRDCDLLVKKKAKSSTLSGGQKRKLQLAIMFTGGSNVCAIDEVSSGLDPLSRRKIWDIILAARGERTIILTTHSLDEADLLADHIAILSKGTLKCEGSAVALKAKMGGGYRVHVPRDSPEVSGVSAKRLYDQTVYNIPDSTSAGKLVDKLEALGVTECHVSGPTIEDVFLKVAEETADIQDQQLRQSPSTEAAGKESDDVNLYAGERLGIFKQTWVMFRKRLVIFKRNYFPIVAAITIPIIAAGLTMIFLKGYNKASCSNADQIHVADVEQLTYDIKFNVTLGPQSNFSAQSLQALASAILPAGIGGGTQNETLMRNLADSLHFVNSLDDFKNYIRLNYHNVTPGGLYLGGGDSSTNATIAFKGDRNVRNALTVQNLADNLLLGQRIVTQYSEFDFFWPDGQGLTLQFVIYMGLALSAFPAFFALYPTVERIRNVRALHYSNGVRALPLWFAYTAFDFIAILITSVICTIIYVAATNDIWFHIGYLFLVLMLYGLASVLMAYNISLMAKSQLSAFAIVAGGQAVMFLLYFIAFMSVLTYAPASKIDGQINIVHFAFSIPLPIGSLARALFVALNLFSVACRGEQWATNPGEMTLYGGPIVYLIAQSICYFLLLLWWDSGRFRLALPWRRARAGNPDNENEVGTAGAEKQYINAEISRVESSNDGLRVVNITKSFSRKMVAVQNVTFGVPRGEVFALLGPNGAGKTTTINMIRGDMAPDSGEIFVENVPVTRRRAEARSHLGVCPQFDAMDRMTVVEHLRFYAQVRGVKDIEHNVSQVIRAVGLEAFQTRMGEKLSGGNKRKLSLGIALMGNPTVLLLDEPSSGMDAASKRIMWKTLAGVQKGRSLVLTTHSMEEAGALASQAGILAKKMLAVGTGNDLRRRWGDGYYIHLVLKSAPASTEAETQNVKDWIVRRFHGAVVEQRSFHGQVRFSVPIWRGEDESQNEIMPTEASQKGGTGVNRALGLKYYSVSQTTLDQVFLTIVGNANVAEGGYEVKKKKWFRFGN
ncbi:P-loop containing nucleoside triphosphate hydrolase protein [Choiromyces venosus 120613-1]|uniref:P-loop containing nucleoside triphosphate hydrolase protein n=1 Tax=Choiromyces venosus 120613-1 TaxID=1336337 RepID=A0A3N4JZZ7_9PEZI|nr:P-loop containing nucleoside triphosphate hydrolase protein [Choiromyces venosus 120613-1]